MSNFLGKYQIAAINFGVAIEKPIKSTINATAIADSLINIILLMNSFTLSTKGFNYDLEQIID